MGTRSSAPPQTGHGFAGARNSSMTDLAASGGDLRSKTRNLCPPGSHPVTWLSLPRFLTEIGASHIALCQCPVPWRYVTGRSPDAPDRRCRQAFAGVATCGLGVKHQEKKCRDPTKGHAGQKKRPLRGLECTQPTLAHDVRHHCRYALHFCLHGKEILLKLYLRLCRDPRCDADHEKPDSGWSGGGRAPAVVEIDRLPADAVAG